LELIKIQGMQLERTCAFASALKYYFAGVQYFNKRHNGFTAAQLLENPDDTNLRELKQKFKDLYDKLIPMTNAEVPAPVLRIQPIHQCF
jgi:hypothetical protein